jgi:uncharacterized integral membrane protein
VNIEFCFVFDVEFYLVWSTYPAGMTDNKCGINQSINTGLSLVVIPSIGAAPVCATTSHIWILSIHLLFISRLTASLSSRLNCNSRSISSDSRASILVLIVFSQSFHLFASGRLRSSSNLCFLARFLTISLSSRASATRLQ